VLVRVKPACGKRDPQTRSMWLFGHEHPHLASACLRPAGHRGECRHHPLRPERPLRPIATILVEHTGNAVAVHPLAVRFAEQLPTVVS
jgi:hypothetical protein